MKVRIFSVGVGGILGFVLLLVGWQALAGGYRYQGSLIDPPVPAADFTLTDQDGGQFRLSDLRGETVLIFFGYTNCPDVCPVTLSNFKQIKADLGEAAGRVRFVFITVDPERDTREKIQQYLGNFDPGFIGLTGTRAELEPVWNSYGVYQARVDSGSAAGYAVDHTARTYLIDPDGNWLLTYAYEMDRRAIVDDLKHLLKKYP